MGGQLNLRLYLDVEPFGWNFPCEVGGSSQELPQARRRRDTACEAAAGTNHGYRL